MFIVYYNLGKVEKNQHQYVYRVKKNVTSNKVTAKTLRKCFCTSLSVRLTCFKGFNHPIKLLFIMINIFNRCLVGSPSFKRGFSAKMKVINNT